MGNAQTYVGSTRMIGEKRYLVEAYLGEGGSAYIFHVVDVGTGQPHALKYMVTNDSVGGAPLL